MWYKLLLVIFFMVTPIITYGAEIHGYFEFSKTLETRDAIAKIELQIHSDIWRLHNELYGGWETWMKFGGLGNSPFKDIYWIGDKITYAPLYLKIEHFCNHPVYSTYNHEWWLKNQRSGNALTTIYIGIEW